MGSTKENVWKCSTCAKTFPRKRNLIRHNLTHDDSEPKAECPICKKILKNAPTLSVHMIMLHTNRKRPSCDTCHKIFSTSANLRRHVAIYHGTKKRPRYPCGFPDCEKSYLKKSSVAQHIRNEHTENPTRFPFTTEKAYRCTTCGRRFSFANNLTRHEVTHLEKFRQRIFKCELCAQTFFHKAHLQRHIQVVHENQRNHPCTFCGKRFSTATNMRIHVEATHTGNAEKIHSCHKCGYKTHSKGTLANHAIRHNPANRRECYFCKKQFFYFSKLICGNIFKTPRTLSTHIKMHHTSRDRPSCDICHRVFYTSETLRRHIDAIHSTIDRPRFPCGFPDCDKFYLTKDDVSAHIKTQHSETPIRFPCTLCGKEFKTRAELEKHISIHTKEKSYVCSTCERRFPSLSNLRSHEVTHLEKSARRIFKCCLCPQMSLTRANLQKHVQVVHENQGNYHCSFCDKRFSTLGNMRLHVDVKHPPNREKIHSCDKCEYRSHSKVYLAQHVKRHNPANRGKNPARFPCTLCGKEFKIRKDLETHISMHTTEKAYVCSTCGRSFSHANSLKRHEATHLEKSIRKVFNCEFCPQDFSFRTSLQRHVQLVHENQRNHPCTFCDERFSTSTNMKRHVEARHPANMEKIHSCDKCEFATHSNANLAHHVRRYNPANRRECYFCQKQFFYSSKLMRHLRRHTLEH
ncbi:Zinc finger protein 91 [Folsomia candida]|uniref:Zinc finger protein 91 n=1 Tax=Folsomia candida TaxID=158441 RepID=A0A226DP88_FOLCA|nr:Zinc finger protein 91 [Folsomia candida]